jgi:hypothetical protein
MAGPETSVPISSAQKRAALDAALASRSLSRSDQLRQLLRYLGEKEIAGQAGGLTEYQIGVEGLGLPTSYSPGDDSTVRNRAFTLRKRLEELYRAELKDQRVRMNFHRGSYAPKFELVEEAAAAPDDAHNAAPRWWGWWVLAGSLVGLLVGVAGMGVWSWTQRGGVEAEVREAWGPLLAEDADVVICVTTSPQMPVRALPGQWKPQAGEPVLEAPPQVVRWFETMRPVPTGSKVYLLPTHNSVGLGDALAATGVTRLLAQAGATFQVVPEKVVPLAAMRRRNIVLLGGSADAQSVQHLLAKGKFQIRFNADSGDWSIYEKDGAKQTFVPQRNAANQLVETFGMVTVLPSEGSEGKQRTVIFSSSYTAGNQAAMEYFTSAKSLRELRSRMGGKLPEAYQVIVRTSVNQMLPLAYRYETHSILE